MKSSPYFNQIVKSRLKETGVQNVDELMSILMKTGSVIAGSFPLQCLLGERYDKSDIDIFCKGYNNKECSDIMNERGRVYPSICDVDRYIFDTYGTKGIPSEYLIEGILRSKMYTVNDKLRFNVIQVAFNPMNFVKNTFDFTFCQTVFDGLNLHFYPLTLQKIGWRAHMAFPRYKAKQPYHRTNKRRDITEIPATAYPVDPHKALVDQFNRRSEKYKQRGFTIYDVRDLAYIKTLLAECDLDTALLQQNSSSDVNLSRSTALHNNTHKPTNDCKANDKAHDGETSDDETDVSDKET